MRDGIKLYLAILFCVLLAAGCHDTSEQPTPANPCYIEVEDSVVLFKYSCDTLYINSDLPISDGRLVCHRSSPPGRSGANDAPDSFLITEIGACVPSG